MGYHIMVNLKADRKQLGSLKMYNDSGALVFGPKQALGRSEYDTSWSQPNGHTPTGVYTAKISGPMPQTSDNEYSFGPSKYIEMDPVSGNALIAKQNGRTGLWIHGGAPAVAGATSYPLRPTHGCVRLSNNDQASLIYVLSTLGGGVGKVTISEV
ncbi:L,D-transpeptidase [Paenibacillus tengchongensis]|uniref:L,D-transpeptidase n=1 Tax=Paenibacillus tengchongensis TaxID=2608684 RepID=UPI00124DA081|nr:L,D-transpeptidase [Paenibacillus tengchongensis]